VVVARTRRARRLTITTTPEALIAFLSAIARRRAAWN
jgi:hypothetical protein